MKHILLISSLLFIFACNSKKQVKSESEYPKTESTQSAYTFDVDIKSVVDTSSKMASHFVGGNEEGEIICLSSLQGKPDLASKLPEGYQAYPDDHEVYTKKIVSGSQASQMSEEELQNVYILPDKAMALPECSLDYQNEIAQVEHVVTDPTREEMANLVANQNMEVAVAGKVVKTIVGSGFIFMCFSGSYLVNYWDEISSSVLNVFSDWREAIKEVSVPLALYTVPITFNYVKNYNRFILIFGSICATITGVLSFFDINLFTPDGYKRISEIREGTSKEEVEPNN